MQTSGSDKTYDAIAQRLLAASDPTDECELCYERVPADEIEKTHGVFACEECRRYITAPLTEENTNHA